MSFAFIGIDLDIVLGFFSLALAQYYLLKCSHIRHSFYNHFQFTLACMKMGRPELARKAVDLAEKRLPLDRWPEYYDTRNGKFIGKQARLYQTWSIAGFLTSKMLLDNPEIASLLYWEEDYELLEICVCALRDSGRIKCSRGAAKSQILVQKPDVNCSLCFRIGKQKIILAIFCLENATA